MIGRVLLIMELRRGGKKMQDARRKNNKTANHNNRGRNVRKLKKVSHKRWQRLNKNDISVFTVLKCIINKKKM